MCEEELENVSMNEMIMPATTKISNLQSSLDELVINEDTSLIKIDSPERLQLTRLTNLKELD